MKCFALVALLAALPTQPPVGLQTFTLPNGLQVLLLEDHATPLIRATLRVTWEANEEPPGKEGLGVFLGLLLERTGPGFQARSAFDRSVAAAGVRLHFRPAPNRLDWAASARSADQEAAIQAITHLVMRPGLDGRTVEALRLSTSRSLEALAPANMVQQRFLASLRTFAPVEGAPLSRIGRADLEAFHHRVIRPERAVLGFTGDLNLAQAKALALLHLGAWGPAPASPPVPRAPLPSLFSHPEGAPEAWLGAALPNVKPNTRAATELLTRILEGLPNTPLVRHSGGNDFLLARESAASVEALPVVLQTLRTRWEKHSASLTPEALATARKRWFQEEFSLPLNPGRMIDRHLDRRLGRAPNPEEIQAASLEEVQAVWKACLASPRLLLLGVPKGTLAAWRKDSPAFTPWAHSPSEALPPPGRSDQPSTTTPKREAKSR